MSEIQSKKITRRTLLKGAAMLAGLATVPLVQVKDAEAKVPKAAMQYQGHPKGNDHCSTCMHFIPGATPTAMGQCKVVAGSISPQGWCVAFTPKKA